MSDYLRVQFAHMNAKLNQLGKVVRDFRLPDLEGESGYIRVALRWSAIAPQTTGTGAPSASNSL